MVNSVFYCVHRSLYITVRTLQQDADLIGILKHDGVLIKVVPYQSGGIEYSIKCTH